jgi:hypothetical protein
MREWAWRVFEVLFFVVVALTVLGSFINWIRGVDDGRPLIGVRLQPSQLKALDA